MKYASQALQLFGVGVFVFGLYLLFGLAITLVVAGVVVTTYGALKEAGRV